MTAGHRKSRIGQSCCSAVSAQPDVRVHRRRVPDHRQHRQVAHAVAVGVAVRQAQVFLFGVDAHPACLGRGGHHRGQQAPGRVAIDELQAIRHIVVDFQVLGERSDGDVERARHQHLAQPQLTRLVYQLVGAREDRRPQHRVEQLLGQAAQAVLRFALVAHEEQVVEQPAVVEVRRHEHRDADQRRGGLERCSSGSPAGCARRRRTRGPGWSGPASHPDRRRRRRPSAPGSLYHEITGDRHVPAASPGATQPSATSSSRHGLLIVANGA